MITICIWISFLIYLHKNKQDKSLENIGCFLILTIFADIFIVESLVKILGK